MNSADLEQLQACCRDQAAFEQMQRILTTACNRSSLELQSVLRAIARIRETPALATIFQTAVTEVREVLNADRVVVFRFDSDSNCNCGTFIAEAVLPQFPSALAEKIWDGCFAEQYASHYRQGRIHAITDIEAVELQECYRAVLTRFQIRANLIVPVLQGCELLGLLCVHQCAAPRPWQPDEIEFTRQIAAELMVALNQAELLAQMQRQSQELTQALDQLNKSQTQLIHQEKLSKLGQLVVGLAHEINNPVNFICGNLTHAEQYAQQLIELATLYQQEPIAPSPQLQQYLEERDLDFTLADFPKLLSSMKIGSDRIRQLVLSLRNFSRVDSTEMQPTNLHQGIDSTLLILHHRLKSKSNSRGINVICEYGELPLVMGYTNQLDQVFMNLISNAIDAVEEVMMEIEPASEAEPYRPQITIRTLQIPDPQGENPRVVICIADNGAGIPASIQDSLFDPFFTTKPIGKGTGLGLSISRSIIVEQHSGELQCYSQLGKGTEFWIELPVKQVGRTQPAHSDADSAATQPAQPHANGDALVYKA
jgi:signal transduction histidine kinase